MSQTKSRKNLFLTKKEGEPKSVKFATFDVEANEWTKLEMVGFYDGTTYTRFDTMEAFFHHVVTHKYRGYKIFAHYGGKYDDLFLLDYLHKNAPKTVFTTITQGSKVLSLKIKTKSKRNAWTFCDSSGLFPNLSLEKLTKSFDVKHKKMAGTIDFKTERVSKDNPLHCEYLKNDVIGLYETIEKFLETPKVREEGFNLTIASQAMGMWRRTLKHSLKMTSQPLQDFCRQSYVGGRTEIFKMKGSDLNYYDVNSLYPFVMRSNRIPTEYKKQASDLSNELGFFDVTVRAPDSYIPILPLKFDGKLLFANGEFRGVYYSEELKLAIENGYQIVKIHEGHVFEEATDLFSEYIDYFFDLKQKAQKGSAQELISKLFLNSLYGKFGQKEERVTLKIWEGEKNCYPFHSEEIYEQTGLVEVPRFHRSPYMLSHIAAAITSYARIHMAKSCYLLFPQDSYYTDTDSIFTSRTLQCGSGIGELKLENERIDGIFKLPKAYYLEKDGKYLDSKIKGFSKDFIKTISKNDFDQLNFKEQKEVPCTLKTSIIRNKNYLSKIGITKSIQSEYSKRRILRGGDTEPWIFKNGELVNRR